MQPAGGRPASVPREPADVKAARKLWTPPQQESQRTRLFGTVRELVLWVRMNVEPKDNRVRRHARTPESVTSETPHINGYNVYITRYGTFGVKVMIPSRRMNGDHPFAHNALAQAYHRDVKGVLRDATAFCTICNSDQCYGCLWALHELYRFQRPAIPDPHETGVIVDGQLVRDELPF